MRPGQHRCVLVIYKYMHEIVMSSTFHFVASARRNTMSADAALNGEHKKFMLYPYDVETMLEPDYTVVLFGSRGSGKTVMLRYLLKCLKSKLDLACVFTPTADTRKMFCEHVPPPFVYPDFDMAAINRIVLAQKDLNAIMQANESNGRASARLRSIGIILDDCGFDTKLLNSDDIKEMFMNGRHDKFFPMVTTQYPLAFKPDIRNNIDVSIVFRTSNPKTVEKLRENLLPCFDTDEELMEVFQNGLQKHEALVFDRRAFEKGSPYLFFLKADPNPGHFQVGSRLFWEMYYKHMVRATTEAQNARIMSTIRMARNETVPEALKRTTSGSSSTKKKTGTAVVRVQPGAAMPELPF